MPGSVPGPDPRQLNGVSIQNYILTPYGLSINPEHAKMAQIRKQNYFVNRQVTLSSQKYANSPTKKNHLLETLLKMQEHGLFSQTTNIQDLKAGRATRVKPVSRKLAQSSRLLGRDKSINQEVVLGTAYIHQSRQHPRRFVQFNQQRKSCQSEVSSPYTSHRGHGLNKGLDPLRQGADSAKAYQVRESLFSKKLLGPQYLTEMQRSLQMKKALKPDNLIAYGHSPKANSRRVQPGPDSARALAAKSQALIRNAITAMNARQATNKRQGKKSPQVTNR